MFAETMVSPRNQRRNDNPRGSGSPRKLDSPRGKGSKSGSRNNSIRDKAKGRLSDGSIRSANKNMMPPSPRRGTDPLHVERRAKNNIAGLKKIVVSKSGKNSKKNSPRKEGKKKKKESPRKESPIATHKKKGETLENVVERNKSLLTLYMPDGSHTSLAVEPTSMVRDVILKVALKRNLDPKICHLHTFETHEVVAETVKVGWLNGKKLSFVIDEDVTEMLELDVEMPDRSFEVVEIDER